MTMREIDEQEVAAWAVRLSGVWVVLRRGSPRRKLRLELATPDESKARDRYERIVGAMRQGSAVLVDPQSKISAYRSEPMVRTRW